MGADSQRSITCKKPWLKTYKQSRIAAQLLTFAHRQHSAFQQRTPRIVIIMSSLLSASVRERRLRESLSPRGTKGEKQTCHWSEKTIRAQETRGDLVAEINDVLDRVLNDEDSSGRVNCIEIPDCVHARTPCDLHHAALFDFVRQCGPETFQIHQKQLLLPGSDQDWNSSDAETDSDLDSNHEELHSSGKKEDSNLVDDEDDIKHENDNDGTPQSIEPFEAEEDDKEEIIHKDEASVRCLQFIKVNDDRERWLVPISGDDEPAESADELQQCKTVTQPFRSASRATSDRSRGRPAVSKDDPSLLQLVYEIDSDKKDFLKQCYNESPNYRTLIAWITLSIDPSCYQDVQSNEKVVRQRITAPFVSQASDPALAKEGFVYAFRDNDFQLIKIGSTASLEKRKAEIERKCGFVNGLTLVAAAKVKAYKRLENIVHQDLAPHRRFFDCACGQSTTNKGFTRHQEYFQIDDAAAVSTLQLWADFVQEQPWEQDPWTGRFGRNISLRKEWRDKLHTPSKVKSHEKHEAHDERIKRWRDVLGIRTPKAVIVKGTSASSVASGSTMDQERAVNATNRSLSPADTPSKPPKSPVDDLSVVERSTNQSSLSSGILKASSSSKPKKSDHVQERGPCSTTFTFELSHSSKGNASLPRGSALVANAIAQARSMPNDQSVDPAETKPSSILQGIAERQPYTAGRFATSSDGMPATGNDQPSCFERVFTSTTLEGSAAPGPFSHIRFNPDWSSSSSNYPANATQTSTSNMEPEQLMKDGRPSSPAEAPETVCRQHQSKHSRSSLISEKTPAPCNAQEEQKSATTITASPLANSMYDIATKLLAQEVRPLPARTISTDLWQLRWPLACSVVFALQSPHIPSVLSFLMWSIFLPFFVAELRGWTVGPS